TFKITTPRSSFLASFLRESITSSSVSSFVISVISSSFVSLLHSELQIHKLHLKLIPENRIYLFYCNAYRQSLYLFCIYRLLFFSFLLQAQCLLAVFTTLS